MDYSPSPTKTKPQYAFLDDSIEIGRGYEHRYSPRVESPLKPVKDTETLHDRQRKFYSKYQDLASVSNSPKRSGSSVTTTSRLFKDIDSKEIPLDDDVKINSNMIEKIIRQNESLRQQLKEQKREKDLINGFASGLKEKLIKYKKQNDSLKFDIQKLTEQNELLVKQKVELEQDLQKGGNKSPELKYKFDPDNTKDIFPGIENEESSSPSPKEKPAKVEKEQPLHNAEPTLNPQVEKKFEELEAEILKISNNQDSKFDYIKNEIEFLKKLSLQLNNDNVNESTNNTSVPKEDDQIIQESEELKNLQLQVDLFTKKLQIREENKQRKYKLTQELSKLTSQLAKDDIPFDVSISSTANSTTNPNIHSNTTTTTATSNIQEGIHTPTGHSTRSPLQEETNTYFEGLKKQFVKPQCEVCEEERPSVNIEGTKWYQ